MTQQELDRINAEFGKLFPNGIIPNSVRYATKYVKFCQFCGEIAPSFYREASDGPFVFVCDKHWHARKR